MNEKNNEKNIFESWAGPRLYQKQLNLWVTKKTYEKTWDKHLRTRFMQIGKLSPNAGDFMLITSDIISKMFFDNAKKIGVNPMPYSIHCLTNIAGLLEENQKVKKSLNELVSFRDETIHYIDKEYTSHLQSIIDKKHGSIKN